MTDRPAALTPSGATRAQLRLGTASWAVRAALGIRDTLAYGIGYALPFYFARSAKPVDPEPLWRFITTRQPALVQSLIDNWPPAPLRERILRRFLEPSHATGIEYHYDVSNDFYALFLDRRFMFYTCADFHSPGDTIEDAQLNKANHILSLIDPKPGERIIELGCGWGSMMKHIQAHTGDAENLSGLTLSQDQLAYVRGTLGLNAELDDFITRDYGTGTYDKIYSIGSFEHIKPDEVLPLYRRLHAALKPGGRAVFHFFSLNGTDRWPVTMVAAQAYFPGSTLSLHQDHLDWARQAGFRLVHDSQHDYRPTLRAWFDRLVENRDKAHALVGVPVTNKYLVFFAASWTLFDLGKATLHRLVLMKD
jgi:cyclopropane-fatty-acyl-phospholipid synthase